MTNVIGLLLIMLVPAGAWAQSGPLASTASCNPTPIGERLSVVGPMVGSRPAWMVGSDQTFGSANPVKTLWFWRNPSSGYVSPDGCSTAAPPPSFDTGQVRLLETSSSRIWRAARWSPAARRLRCFVSMPSSCRTSSIRFPDAGSSPWRSATRNTRSFAR